MPVSRQLLLPFPHVPSYDSRDFLPADSNQETLAWLEAAWPEHRLAVWGPDGCGKSHLLHIWAERASAPLLNGRSLRNLDALPDSGGAVVIDDADAISSETLLLHLLNTARDRALQVLISGHSPPSRWKVCLPDLSSRLRAIAAVEIRPPSDDLLAALLFRLLSDRQLSVPQSVQEWLLTRLPRSPAALRHAVERLDRASMASSKAITRSLAAMVLGEGDPFACGSDEVSVSVVDPSSKDDRGCL